MLKWAAWIVVLLISAPNHQGKRLDPPKNGQCPNVGGDNIYGCPYFNANCRVCIGDHMDAVIYAWYLLDRSFWYVEHTQSQITTTSSSHKDTKQNNTDQFADERIVEVVTTFPEIHHQSTTAVSDWDRHRSEWLGPGAVQCLCICRYGNYMIVFMGNDADLNDWMDIGIIINPQYKC